MPLVKQFIDLPMGMLAYVKAGPSPAAGAALGEPVVFLHGIPTSSFMWRRVLDELAPTRLCYALDMLGYGDSDQPADRDLSVAAQAGYLKAWAGALGLAAFHLAGHDIGGGVAQQFAVQDQSRVRSLILVDSICYDSWPEPNIARLKEPQWDATLRARDLRPGFRRALETGLVHKERVTDEMVEGYVAPFLGQAGRQAYLRCARALDTRDTTSIADQVEQLDVPTLILWGEQDPYQKIEYGRRLAKAMRRASLQVCTDGGHFLPEDRPDWVAQQIRAFLSATIP